MTFEEIYEKAKLRETIHDDFDDNPMKSDVANRMIQLDYLMESLNHGNSIRRFQPWTDEPGQIEVMLAKKLEKSRDTLRETLEFCINNNPEQKRISFSQYLLGERQK
jgi:hypothetical protein